MEKLKREHKEKAIKNGYSLFFPLNYDFPHSLSKRNLIA